VEDISGSLTKNRKTYFPNFALGLLKYGAEMVGPLGPENYGDLIIAKQVSKTALSKFLRLPLYWDRDAAREFEDRGVFPVVLIPEMMRRTRVGRQNSQTGQQNHNRIFRRGIA
jgi:hypothetical protein